MDTHHESHDENKNETNDQREGGSNPPRNKVRAHDRRPKGVHPMRRRSICLSPELDQLVMNERMRRRLPSVSALIEHAIAKEVAYKGQVEQTSSQDELRLLRAAIHRLERDTAERDVIQVELIAGLARAHFATVPQPSRDEQPARIAEAKVLFERFLDAIGRRIESGQTTLAQLPELQTFDSTAAKCAGEKNLPLDLKNEGAHNDGV